MDKIKVVVVDDSAFMRKIISDSINSMPELEVVAKFRNGQDFIENVDKYKPDIVTLDIEMPVLNGIDTLKEMKKLNKVYPVIMLSSLTSQNSVYTLECLELGAIDFIEKPSASLEVKSEVFRKGIIEKIIGIVKSNNKKILKAEKQDAVKRINKTIVSTHKKNIDAVVIGASTGGPKALQEVLTKIDGDINVPVLVVQHMPKGFTKAFAERLNGICKIDAVEGQDDMEVKKNTIYIAPGGYHMTVEKDKKIRLNQEPAIWGVRPAVDKLFESAVSVYGQNILSVVLTGMGRDGAHGTEEIKDNGGVTISEDESTCTIYGMPRAAYETGKVDYVLPLPDIAHKINTIVKGR